MRERRVAILGAGGAARSVAAALRGSGARTTIYARKADAARTVAAATGATASGWPPPNDAWDVLVNATPVGTASASASPLQLRGPLAGRLVYDLVYNPPETALLRSARALGAGTIGGLPMLIAQAAAQFEWWTGITAPTDVMRQAALTRLDASRLAGSTRLPMKQTTFEEFVDLAKRGNFVPVCKEIVADLLTPVSAFLKVAEHADYAFLLESVEGGEHVGRYSFLGKDPFLVLRANAGAVDSGARGRDDHARDAGSPKPCGR